MQLVAAATITRFLQPSDYGLAAMAMLCYSMTGYFTQLGMSRAVIQKPDLTEGNIRAAFLLGLATGVAGFAILAAFSPLLGLYFREPRLPRVIAAFGLNLIFQSVSMVTGGLLRREFRIRDLAICDFLGYLLSTFAIGLPMAIRGYGVWALVGSNVSQPLIVAILYYIARPHSIAPTFKREDYRHIATFSGKASATTSVEALGGSLDMIIMGRLVSAASLGLYNRSLTLSTMPGYNVSQGLTRVFHPTIARAAERSLHDCLEILISSERQLMSLIFPFCAAAAVTAPVIIPTVFGSQWTSAVPIYRVLCLVAALDASFHLPSIQLEVLSQFRLRFYLQVLFGLCFGAGILFAAPRGGVIAVAWLYSALQALRTLALHHLSARSLGVNLLVLLKSWIPGLVCAAILALPLATIQRFAPTLHGSGSAFLLAAMIALSIGIVALVYRTLYPNTVYRSWLFLFQKSAD